MTLLLRRRHRQISVTEKTQICLEKCKTGKVTTVDVYVVFVNYIHIACNQTTMTTNQESDGIQL